MVGDAGLATLLLVVLATLGAFVHESWHWLAARARDLPVRFGIDHRLYFVVFETDLSRLWALPRRERFGPLLAGLAIDSVVLAGLLGAQYAVHLDIVALPAAAVRLCAALAYVYVANMVWQCMIFLRTDLYAVLVMATGCRNLWRIKSLLLRRALGRLTDEQAAELARASDRDVRVGRWFRWVWVIGVVMAAGWFVVFVLPRSPPGV